MTLQKDITKFSREGKSVLVLDRFPAAYLMTDMKPHTPNVWGGMFFGSEGEILQTYFMKTHRQPDTIFVIHHALGNWPIADDKHLFNKYIAQNYVQVYANASDIFELIVFERK